jgi:hypothetical protein
MSKNEAIKTEIKYLRSFMKDMRTEAKRDRREARQDRKETQSTLSGIQGELSGIRQYMADQKELCDSRGKTQADLGVRVGDLEKVDVKQEQINIQTASGIQEFKKFAQKWGPMLSVAAFIFFDKII